MELILSETHDFSRAVDGLVKEIYLGMIFLQLQVIALNRSILTKKPVLFS